MAYLIWVAIAVVTILVAVSFAWRYASRRWSLPCPTIFAGAVDGRMANRLSATTATLDRMGLRPGMTVVEIGPGPGRLLVPAARRVLPGGKAIGVELQQGMLDKLRRKLAVDDPGNVELICGDATQRLLQPQGADVVYLCTVLGEIPDRRTALQHCFDALRPGGRLSITEIIMDPHYQTVAKVRALVAELGFEFEDISSNWRMYTANFRRPAA
jgi:SAM-dependent methyltransferase